MRGLIGLISIAIAALAPLSASAYSCAVSPTKDAVSDLQGRLHVQGGGWTGHVFLLATDSSRRQGLVRLPAPDRRQGTGIRQRQRELQVGQAWPG